MFEEEMGGLMEVAEEVVQDELSESVVEGEADLVHYGQSL